MRTKITKLFISFAVVLLLLLKAYATENKSYSGADFSSKYLPANVIEKDKKEARNKSPLAIIPGGDLSGHLVIGDSPYTVTGDVNIPLGDELIVDPGVELQFDAGCKLIIYGRLLAEGLIGNQIVFTTSDPADRWEGLRFSNTNTNGQDSSKLVHCIISKSSADPGGPSMNNQGGAIYFRNSSAILVKDCLMEENYAASGGGAVYIDEYSKPDFINNILKNNSSPFGAAMYFSYGEPTIQNCILVDNEGEYGGACYLKGSDPIFSGVSIHNNNAKFGGAIYLFGGSTPEFDSVSLSSMYGNYAYACGLELFADNGWFGNTFTVHLDTFDVALPNAHFAYPYDGTYTFDIQTGLVVQTDQDLYVSPTGSDSNSGLSALEPLQTFYMANMKSLSQMGHWQNIFIASGTYSEGASNEKMPINARFYNSMMGDETGGCLLDGENLNQILYCYDDHNFFIVNLEFFNGVASNGGAICIDYHSDPFLNDLKLYNNEVTEKGGAIFINDHSNPELIRLDIYDNFAGSVNHGTGGGIAVRSYSNPIIKSTNIYNNISNFTGGGIGANLHCNVKMDNGSVYNNSSANGAGLYFNFHSEPYLRNIMIHDNHAVNFPGYPANGGGVYVSYHSHAVFDKVIIYDNTSEQYGGGVSAKAPITFTNGQILNNYASYSGGGIYSTSFLGTQKYISTEICGNNAGDYKGSAIYAAGSDIEFTNTTLSQNYSSNAYECLVYCNNSDLIFTNSIIWDNSPTTLQQASGNIIANHSDVEGSWSGINNIAIDPLFVSPVGGDFRLQASSPCIDTGSPDTTGLELPVFDRQLTPRIINNIVDIGAYEFYDGLRLITHVLLEGPFETVNMRTSISDNIPLSQPFNIPPWNYSGTETISSIPADVVDWVLVDIRDCELPDFAIDATIARQQAAFINKEGNILDIYGVPMLLFDYSPTHSLYVSVRHRNHLGVLSAQPFGALEDVFFIDFRNDSTNAFGVDAQKVLPNGRLAMYGGDGDANGIIESPDISTVWSSQAGEYGYLNADFNLDNVVDNVDKNDIYIPNIGKESQIP